MKEINPYLPPTSTLIQLASPEIEAIRRQHLGYETAIKVIGSLCQLTGLFSMLIGGI